MKNPEEIKEKIKLLNGAVEQITNEKIKQATIISQAMTGMVLGCFDITINMLEGQINLLNWVLDETNN